MGSGVTPVVRMVWWVTMPDQLDVESAIAINAIRRRVNTFQRMIGNPVMPYPIRLPDGRDVQRIVIKQ